MEDKYLWVFFLSLEVILLWFKKLYNGCGGENILINEKMFILIMYLFWIFLKCIVLLEDIIGINNFVF